MRLLLVEDNPSDARLIREMLRETPAGTFQLEQVSRLETARKRLQEQTFDAILLDLRLPDSQGIETLFLLRKFTSETPIVVLTGLDDQSIALEARQAGAQDYLTKGRFDTALLVRAIRYAFERQRAEASLQRERQRLHDVLDTLPVMVGLLTPDYRIAFANGCFREHYGNPDGRYCYEYIFGLSAPCAFCESFEVLKTGRPHRWERISPDGQKMVDVYDFPFTDSDGSPLVLEMEVDVTEIRKAEAVLKEVNVTLEQRVADRTAQIQRAIEGLRLEIADRERAEEEVNRRNRILKGISTIFHEALHCDSDEELGATCLRVAEEITVSEFGLIGEIGGDGLLHNLKISDLGWQRCEMPDKTGAYRKPLGDLPIHGLYGWVLQEGRTLRTNSPAQHPASIGTPPGHPQLTAFLGVPLKDDTRTVGLIAVGNREGGYRQEDQEALEALAPAISEALHRKRAEEALRQSQQQNEFLAHLIRTSSQPLAVRNSDGSLGLVNRAFEQLTGYSAEELRSLYWAKELTAPEWRQTEADKLAQLYRTGRPVRYEKEYLRKDGTRVPVELLVQLLTEPDGKSQQYAFVTDITERKLAEQAMVRSEKLAAAGRMAATVAHEINNPLAAVMNSIYIALLDPTMDEPTRQHLRTAEQELIRVASLTRQTLGFYRERTAAEPVAVAALLEEVLRTYQHKLRDKQVRVIKQIAVQASVTTVMGELRQAISNLVANSIDALPEGGRLRIHARQVHTPASQGIATRRLMITVADDGVGIAPELRERIFEPFFTTKQEIGTGLGLWVTRGLLRKNGGSIRMRSRPGRGTVFTIFLPMPAAAAAAATAR